MAVPEEELGFGTAGRDVEDGDGEAVDLLEAEDDVGQRRVAGVEELFGRKVAQVHLVEAVAADQHRVRTEVDAAARLRHDQLLAQHELAPVVPDEPWTKKKTR